MERRNGRVKLLSLTVWITVWLLAIAATLVVLGVFNQQLRWDLFSPQAESILYGVFFSAVILSIFGVAIAFVLGLKRIVDAVEALERKGKLDGAIDLPAPGRLTYVGYTLGLFTAFAALISGLGFVDHQVQVHRSQVFRRIAGTQMQKLGKKFAVPLSEVGKAPLTTKTTPPPLVEVMKALKELPFVQEATLYVADTSDRTTLWRYRDYFLDAKTQHRFERLIVLKTFEEAIQNALNGNPKALESLNQQTNLEYFHTIQGNQGKPIAVLKINGNPQENFRDYRESSSL
jgi:hypothetical protein